MRIDLMPGEEESSLFMSFSLPGADPGTVEKEVTSLLESACSQLEGVEKIISVSNYDYGHIQLNFDRSADMPFKQMELSALIRRVYPALPPAASYPVVSGGGKTSATSSPLLVYSISAPVRPYSIKQRIEPVIREALADVDGVQEISIPGVEDMQLSILYDKTKCEALRVEPASIAGSLASYYTPAWPGDVKTGSNRYFLSIPAPLATVETIENMLIALPDKQRIRLKQVAQVRIAERAPGSYFRINGRDAVTCAIYANGNRNRSLLAGRIKKLMHEAAAALPESFEMRLDYDDTELITGEIRKSMRRIGLSLAILLVFILIAYRSWARTVIIVSSLWAALCLAVLLVWLLKIDVNIYTVAGLAISFGIMTDNAIVVLDYCSRGYRKGFSGGLLAANLATASAFALVFLLPDEIKRNLSGVAMVIVIALSASFVTSIWLTPALHRLLGPARRHRALKEGRTMYLRRRKWRQVKLYSSFMSFLSLHRAKFLVLVLLGFGLPVFLLPQKWEGKAWYHNWYNASLGSEYYQLEIKPLADKWLGGALRLFVTGVAENSGYRTLEKTTLFVHATMPLGTTLAQMNTVVAEVEDYLSGIAGIEKYEARVYNGQRAAIAVSFKGIYEQAGLPYQLKSALVSRAVDRGGTEWNIYGVGSGFSNAMQGELADYRIILRGYNSNSLDRIAARLEEKLRQQMRVSKINTNERLGYDQKESKAYYLDLDAAKAALHNTSGAEISARVRGFTAVRELPVRLPLGDRYLPVVLEEQRAVEYSYYDLLNRTVYLDRTRAVKLGGLGTAGYSNTLNSVYKEDRQYVRVVGFEFNGTAAFGNSFTKDLVKEVAVELPLGYSIEQQNWSGIQGIAGSFWGVLLALVALLFFIYSVMLENLRKPFFIIIMIPVSFIGILLTFSLNSFWFDQGGYAAFVMVGGLVSNAGVFIVNDLNRLKKAGGNRNENKLLVKAVLHRSGAILLTILSTCLGLLPFLMDGPGEVFWFSLAAGTIGGLLFSLPAVFIILPVLLWKQRQRPAVTRQANNRRASGPAM